MHYTDETLLEAVAKEKQLQEFFLNVRSFAREMAVPAQLNSTNQRWTKADIALNEKITQVMTDVDSSFRDNFDYPNAMNCIFDLMKDANKYMGKQKAPKILLLNKAAEFINNILKTLGIVADGEDHFLGSRQFELEEELTAILNFTCQVRNQIINVYRNFKKGKGGSIEEAHKLANEYLNELGQFSENSKDAESGNMHQILVASLNQFLTGVVETKDFDVVMQLSDKLRDADLVTVGVQIEDKGSTGTSLWKLFYPASLLIEKNNQVLIEKKENQLKNFTDELKKWKTYQTALDEFKLSEEELNGLSKSKRKKYGKQKKKAEGNYKKYTCALEKKSDFLEALQADIASLEAEISSAKNSSMQGTN